MRKQILPQDTRLVDDQGRATADFYDLLRNVMENLPTMPVAETAPTANQVLVFNATTGKYTPGAN